MPTLQDNYEMLQLLCRRTLVNRWLYAMGLVLIVAATFTVLTVVRGIAREATKQSVTQTAILNSTVELENSNEVKIEAANQTLVDYMKRTVDYLDYLQKHNPQLDVPKAVGPRAPGYPPPSEKELERPRIEHPKLGLPSPTPITIIKDRYRHRKPPPTPRPWWNFFKTR